MLKGYVDIYLPDLKYYDDKLSKKYSNISNYFSTATASIIAMYNQVGTAKFNNDGLMEKGIIIRHLILPRSYAKY